MFIVLLSYIKPLDKVDYYLSDHLEFIKEQYKKGHFIASGRKIPRTGGVILARGTSKKELRRILEQDPFQKAGVADYDIVEFSPSRAAEGFDNLKEI